MKNYCNRILKSALILIAMLPMAVFAEQLLRNPTMLDKSGNGLPEDWYCTTKRQGDIQKKQVGESRFIRLSVEESGESVILQQFNKLPKGIKEVTIAAKVRWKDIKRGKKPWMVGGIQLMFENSKRKKTGDYQTISLSGSSKGWEVVHKTIAVPDDAVKFRSQAALYFVAQGSLDIAWITVTPGAEFAKPAANELKKQNVETSKPDKILLDSIPLPPGNGPEYAGVKGVSVLGNKPFELLKPYRNLQDFDATLVPVEGMPFNQAMKINVRKQPNAVWDMQLRGKPKVPVNKGDKLLLTLYIRGLFAESEFGETFTLVAWQLDRSPWSAAFSMGARTIVDRGWKKIQRVMVSPVTLTPENSAVNFQFGMTPQAFELGGLTLYNYGKKIDVKALPRIKEPLYEGHQLDHPWRKAANERIEKYRKADLKIQVVDADGKPVADAKVDIKMKKHAFLWGTTLYHWFFYGDYMKNAKTRKYITEAAKLFNFYVSENGYKWSSWEDLRGRKGNDNLAKWVLDNGFQMRGHTTIWPSFNRSPKRLEKLRNNPEALRAEINKHIDAITTREKGKMREWDVMNEPTTNYDFMRILGNDEPAKWFKRVHAIDPNAKLFLNENQILAGTKLKSLENWLDRLVKDGAPLGGIGIQGHMGVGTAPPEKMLEIYDRLSRFKVPLAITELDVLSSNPELQAMYLRDVMIASFSHPSVESITFWGFWDGRHWKKNTPLFDENWNPKPGLAVYKKLVFSDWWTDETKTTDKNGIANVRGFKGDYEITVEVNGQKKTVPVKLINDKKFTVKL